MQEIANKLGFGADDEPRNFSSPLESFEYALDRVQRLNISRIDLVTWVNHPDGIHMYLRFPGALENSNVFSPEQIEDQLLDFFHAQYHSDPMIDSVRKHQFAVDAIQGEEIGLFARSVFWEVPIGNNLVIGERSQVDRDGYVLSRSFFVGKPFAERNLRPGQKIHRYLSQTLFRT